MLISWCGHMYGEIQYQTKLSLDLECNLFGLFKLTFAFTIQIILQSYSSVHTYNSIPRLQKKVLNYMGLAHIRQQTVPAVAASHKAARRPWSGGQQTLIQHTSITLQTHIEHTPDTRETDRPPAVVCRPSSGGHQTLIKHTANTDQTHVKHRPTAAARGPSTGANTGAKSDRKHLVFAF